MIHRPAYLKVSPTDRLEYLLAQKIASMFGESLQPVGWIIVGNEEFVVLSKSEAREKARELDHEGKIQADELGVILEQIDHSDMMSDLSKEMTERAHREYDGKYVATKREKGKCKSKGQGSHRH